MDSAEHTATTHPLFVTQLQPIDEPLYQCSCCLECDLTRSFKFCPHCGKQIAWTPDLEMLISPERMQFNTALTKRQQDVLLKRGQAMTLKEIATELGIAFKTAEVHLVNAQRKLRLHGLVDVIRFVNRAGLVDGQLRAKQK